MAKGRKPKKSLSPIKRVNEGPDKNFNGGIASVAKNMVNTGMSMGAAGTSKENIAQKIGGQVKKSFQMHDNNPKTVNIAGQSIHESGHSMYNIENGPSEGDLIRGEHIQRDESGLVRDLDYKVQMEKDTSDANGPYKIWKTVGIK